MASGTQGLGQDGNSVPPVEGWALQCGLLTEAVKLRIAAALQDAGGMSSVVPCSSEACSVLWACPATPKLVLASVASS